MNGNIQRLAFICIVVAAMVVAGGCLGIVDSGSSNAETTTAVSTATEPGDISGTVVDPNLEEPVSGATVSLSGAEVETGEDGSFEFTGVEPGQKQLGVSKDGYAEGELSVSVASEEPVEVALKNDRFFKPNESVLGATHVDGEGSCGNCHEGSATEINSSASDDSCLSCHALEDVINSTSDLKHNPHDDPHGYGQDCSSCHKVHTESEDSCADCHPDDWIPQPP